MDKTIDLSEYNNLLPRIKSKMVSANILKSEDKQSASSGKHNIVLLCEIVAPDSVRVDGVEHTIAGSKFSIYLPLAGPQLAKTRQVFKNLGLPSTIDLDNLAATHDALRNLKIDVTVATKETFHTEHNPDTNKEEFIMRDGQKVSKGYGFDYVDPLNIIGLSK